MASVTQKAFGLLALSSLMLGGCAYKSFYKATNNKVTPAPVAAKNVKVYKQRDDVADADEVIELGLFRASAPTVDEAMDTAKRICGEKGATMYILNTAPFRSNNSYRVDGMCATTPEAAKAEPANGSTPKPITDNDGGGKPL